MLYWFDFEAACCLLGTRRLRQRVPHVIPPAIGVAAELLELTWTTMQQAIDFSGLRLISGKALLVILNQILLVLDGKLSGAASLVFS